MIRILIADDHPFMRDGLRAMISTQPDMEVVAEAENGLQAVEMFRQHRPEIVLMDLRMPAMSGVEATREIRSRFRDARIIVLTTYDGDEDIYRALQAGARSYLLKEMRRREVLAAIRAVHQGRKAIPPEIQATLEERIPLSHLTGRELQILKMMAKGLSNKEIGNELDITESTVKFHTKSLLGKLGARDRTQAVVFALQRGILQIP